jgi:GT2 family glycosyltransferase
MAGVGAAYPSGQHQTGIRSNEIRDEYQRFNWLPFASEVLNPQMIREVGLLDRNLVMWFSDSDYCMRANWVGWKVMMDRGSVVKHHNHATLGNPNKELFLRDYIAFQQKWGGLVLKGVS